MSQKQHYIPAFYQKKFRDDNDQIFVLKRGGQFYTSNPQKKFKQNNFQMLLSYEPSMEPDILEEEFAKIESDATDIITEILESKKLPDDERLGTLAALVALLRERNLIKKEQLIKTCSDPEDIWNRDDVTMAMVKNSANLIDEMNNKYFWGIVETRDSEFISSDSPVSIHAMFSNARHCIILPLSSHVALILSISYIRSYSLVDERLVALINFYTAGDATEVFGPKKVSWPTNSDFGILQNFLLNQ